MAGGRGLVGRGVVAQAVRIGRCRRRHAGGFGPVRRQAGQRFLADLAPFPIETGDLVGRNLIFIMAAPGEDHERGERAEQAEGDQPPDVPDQREAGGAGEEGGDEAGRRVARHFDRRPARR